MTDIALFFNSKAGRDAAYAAIRPLLLGVNHGVSGPQPDLPAQWQLWAAVDRLNVAAVDAALAGITCVRAADGRLAATLLAAMRES